MIEILRYFTDTFLRCSFMDEEGNIVAFCYMVGEGDEDHCYWGPPELYPEEYLRSRPADLQLLMIRKRCLCKHGCSTLHIIFEF